jgi:hypothetical protein
MVRKYNNDSCLLAFLFFPQDGDAGIVYSIENTAAINIEFAVDFSGSVNLELKTGGLDKTTRINQGETRFFELNVDARMAKHSPLIFNAVPLATAPHEQVLSLPPPFCLPCTKHEDFSGERSLPAHCADSGRPGDGRV